MTTGYACREHPDHLVTWRGTGCQPCTDGDRKRRARRAVRSKERRMSRAHRVGNVADLDLSNPLT